MTGKLLKLQAKDVEDVTVVSAVLQDAIVPVCDMLWRPEDKNFVLVAQRLCRESTDETLHRICCAVNMTGVDMVQTQGIDLHDQARMLNLLMMVVEGNGLHFVFAGGAQIRAQMANWSMIVEDFGESWPAGCEPCHDSPATAVKAG